MALLVVLHRARRGTGRAQARALGRAWLQAFITELPEPLLRAGLADAEFALCGIATLELNVCPHWQAAQDPEESGTSPVDRFFLKLLRAAEQGLVCQASQAWAKRACRFMADALNDILPQSKSETNPLNMQEHLMGRSGKQRRYDEDYKMAVTGDVVEKKRALSATAYAQAVDNLAVKTAASWDYESLGWYQASSWATFRKAENVSITMDSSRIGQPALDLMFYAMHSVGIGRAVWLPPQAFVGRCQAWARQGPHFRHPSLTRGVIYHRASRGADPNVSQNGLVLVPRV